jgi:hypothetical protein
VKPNPVEQSFTTFATHVSALIAGLWKLPALQGTQFESFVLDPALKPSPAAHMAIEYGLQGPLSFAAEYVPALQLTHFEFSLWVPATTPFPLSHVRTVWAVQTCVPPKANIPVEHVAQVASTVRVAATKPVPLPGVHVRAETSWQNSSAFVPLFHVVPRTHGLHWPLEAAVAGTR